MVGFNQLFKRLYEGLQVYNNLTIWDQFVVAVNIAGIAEGLKQANVLGVFIGLCLFELYLRTIKKKYGDSK
jgi:hypothetical protein